MFTNMLQPTHLLIISIVALLILGPRRLPDAGRALGQGIKEFRNSISGDSGDNHSTNAPAVAQQDESAPPQPPSRR